MTKEHDEDEELEIIASPSSQSTNPFNILPMAIVLAALLISASILYGGKQLTKALGTVASNSSAAQQTSTVTGTQTAQAQQTQPQGLTPGQKVNVDVGHLPVKGNPNAKVKIIEFADLRCPFCERFFQTVEPQLLKDYVDTGKVAFYFRQYEFLGPASVTAGNAAECANEQNKFWEMHDYLYKNQPQESDTSLYNTDSLTKIAGQLGLNISKFKSCLSSTKYDKNVQDDLAAGQKAGVTGTPTVFINGTPIVGAQPYSAFKTAIDQALSN
jgi:protein-disulfide isomerase